MTLTDKWHDLREGYFFIRKSLWKRSSARVWNAFLSGFRKIKFSVYFSNHVLNSLFYPDFNMTEIAFLSGFALRSLCFRSNDEIRIKKQFHSYWNPDKKANSPRDLKNTPKKWIFRNPDKKAFRTRAEELFHKLFRIKQLPSRIKLNIQIKIVYNNNV